MINIINERVYGFEAAIRGMRNPMNSWEKSDSVFDISHHYDSYGPHGLTVNGNIIKLYEKQQTEWEQKDPVEMAGCFLGENDFELCMNLAKNGSVHAKYRRMITVYVDITAPLYWWKEFDTYKVGTVANSCSTMHKIHSKKFTLDDFSYEHLTDVVDEEYLEECNYILSPKHSLEATIEVLNAYRNLFIKTKEKKYWWQMIQLLPSSYNQKRTVMLNYEVLAGIYEYRKNHKLDEWRDFCSWIKTLPYSEIITGEMEER